MKMKKFKIAIIGNGKVAKALLNGFLRSFYKKSDILIIGRENSDLNYFAGRGIAVSKEMSDVELAEEIILAVTPQGIGPQLKRLKGFKFPYLLSLSSGSDRKKIASYLEVPKEKVVVGTLNTNVHYGKGLITLHGESESLNKAKLLLTPLGKIIFESQKEIFTSVVTIGSMNAFHLRALLIAFKEERMKKSIPLIDWLKDVFIWLGMENDNLSMAEHPHGELYSYLTSMSEILNVDLNCKNGEERVLDTMKSAILALLSIKDLTAEKVEEHIATVVTSGGCTEKGLKKIKNVDDIISSEILWSALEPVSTRAKLFEKEALASFTE